MSTIVVAIATCNRPSGLLRCVQSILNGIRQPDAIVIVDNHESQNGLAAISSIVSNKEIPIFTEAEEIPGISYARNRCVEISRSENYEYIAFIDDDEEASPYWLLELIEKQQSEDFDVVSGPVYPIYADIPNPTLVRTGYYRQEISTRGEHVVADSTANVLVRLSVLLGVKGPFDPSYALTGGSDKKLFLQLHVLGARMAWSPRAIIFEHIENVRLSERWIIQRIRRNASINHRVESDVFGRSSTRETMIGSALLIAGLFIIPIGWISSRAKFLSKSLVAKGKGRLTAWEGKGLREYAAYHNQDV